MAQMRLAALHQTRLLAVGSMYMFRWTSLHLLVSMSVVQTVAPLAYIGQLASSKKAHTVSFHEPNAMLCLDIKKPDECG